MPAEPGSKVCERMWKIHLEKIGEDIANHKLQPAIYINIPEPTPWDTLSLVVGNGIPQAICCNDEELVLRHVSLCHPVPHRGGPCSMAVCHDAPLRCLAWGVKWCLETSASHWSCPQRFYQNRQLHRSKEHQRTSKNIGVQPTVHQLSVQLTVQLTVQPTVQPTVQLYTLILLNPHGKKKKTPLPLVSPWCFGPPATGTAVTPKALAAPSPKLRDTAKPGFSQAGPSQTWLWSDMGMGQN